MNSGRSFGKQLIPRFLPQGEDERAYLRARVERERAVEALTAVISEWTRKHDKHAVMKILGEAGVPGRWGLRKRDVAQPSNIAIVAYEGDWWKLNLAVRDFLRGNAEAARNYALAKWHAVSGGADMLLAYSDAKRVVIERIVAEARGLLKG